MEAKGSCSGIFEGLAGVIESSTEKLVQNQFWWLHANKAGAGFIMRNSTEMLSSEYGIPVVVTSAPDAQIRDLCEALV